MPSDQREEFECAGRGLSSAMLAGMLIWVFVVCAIWKVMQ
jgi:hypothetical protein